MNIPGTIDFVNKTFKLQIIQMNTGTHQLSYLDVLKLKYCPNLVIGFICLHDADIIRI